MKRFIVFVLVLFSIEGFSQKKYDGVYRSYFGQELKINSDKTFFFKSSFDLSSSWSKGQWRISNDTIYLKTEIIKDILHDINYKNNVMRDTLVISQDSIANRINNGEHVAGILSSGGQNRVKPPEKFFFKNNKLYLINNSGNLENRRLKHFWINKKYKTYFKKIQSK